MRNSTPFHHKKNVWTMTKAFVTLILLLPGGLQMSGQPTVEQVVPVAPDFIVAADGSGDFRTIGEAFDAVPDFRKNRTTILVRRGIYREKLVLATSKTNITLLGENRNETVVTWNDFAQKKNRFGEEMGTTGSSTFFVFGEGFRAENITFENSAGPVGQAVAVRVTADRVMFTRCRFLGWQDTLYPQGEESHQYYRECYIEGSVDFIFGWATAFFENCTLYCKKGGYLTAPSTNEGRQHGLVFVGCTVTGDAPEASFYLGRPWRPFGQAVFIGCHLGNLVKPEGWHNWDKPEAEKTAFFAEYGNTGPGATGERVPWMHLLSREEAVEYTPQKILGDWIESE